MEEQRVIEMFMKKMTRGPGEKTHTSGGTHERQRTHCKFVGGAQLFDKAAQLKDKIKV